MSKYQIGKSGSLRCSLVYDRNWYWTINSIKSKHRQIKTTITLELIISNILNLLPFQSPK